MNPTQNILILGASGFIGYPLYEILKDKKDIHLKVLLRKPDKRFDKKHVLIGDIKTFDWNHLPFEPDVVYHLARINASRFQRIGRWIAAQKGRRANLKLKKYLSHLPNACKLIYVAGSLSYGNSNFPITEKSPLSPISFAKEYILAEDVWFQKSVGNLSTQIVRIPWVLGDGSWFRTFYVQPILKEKKIPQYGKGDNVMTLIDVFDVVKCLVNINSNDSILHITGPVVVTQKEWLDYLKQQLQLPIREVPLSNYETAIQEAFTSSIDFKSQYNYFDKTIESTTISQLLDKYLYLFKNI